VSDVLPGLAVMALGLGAVFVGVQTAANAVCRPSRPDWPRRLSWPGQLSVPRGGFWESPASSARELGSI